LATVVTGRERRGEHGNRHALRMPARRRELIDASRSLGPTSGPADSTAAKLGPWHLLAVPWLLLGERLSCGHCAAGPEGARGTILAAHSDIGRPDHGTSTPHSTPLKSRYPPDSRSVAKARHRAFGMANLRREDSRSLADCCRRTARVLVVMAFASATAVGCSGPSQTESANGFEPDRIGGDVDAFLPTAERERRQVLERLLRGIVAGEHIALVSRWLPDVEFRESTAAFLNGNLVLRRWDFARAVSPNAISVALEFIPADDSIANRIERRTYEVTGRCGEWIVDRIAAERTPQ
jgi:hypothetical protein